MPTPNFNVSLTVQDFDSNVEKATNLPFYGGTIEGAARWMDGLIQGLNGASAAEWEEEDGVMFAQVSYVEHDGSEIIMTIQIEEV